MANLDLMRVMHGEITDVNKIAEILTKASDDEFVDVLNYLDGNIRNELMSKLPNKQRNLIVDFNKVDNMSRAIHRKNELFEVNAEEYVKNSENMQAWKINLKDKEFASAREVVDWLNISDEAKELLMNTAVMNATEKSRNVKNLSEKRYKDAVNFEIQLAVYQATVATAAVKQKVNPKVAVQEEVNKFVEEARKQAENKKKEGKSATGFLNASLDSVLAYSASTNEWVEQRLQQAKMQFAGTRLGTKVEEITTKAQNKLAVLDKKLSEHKTWGKTYKEMRKYAPVLGKISRAVAINAGMLTAASMVGPVGMALYASYVVNSSTKPLVKDFMKAKSKNQNLHFINYAADNKWSVAKTAFSAVNAAMAFSVGYGIFGEYALSARIGAMLGTALLTAKANYEQDKVSVLETEKAGGTPLKQASFMRSLKKAAITTAVSFGLGWAFRNGGDLLDGSNDERIENPEETAERLARAQEGDGIENKVVEQPQEVPAAETVSNDNEKYKAALELLKENCAPETPTEVAVTNEDDCEAKIRIQEKAEDNDKLREFWENRAEKFVPDCNDRNAIKALILADVFKLDEMPGINSPEEFTYKYGLMKEMNLPHQRDLVEAISEKIEAAQKIVASGDDLSQINALKGLQYNDSENVMQKAFANGMNSYDNRGNYLCAEPEPVSQPVHKVEETPVDDSKKEETTTVEEPITTYELTQLSFKEGEPLMVEVVDGHQDFDHKEVVPVEGEPVSYDLKYESGESLKFTFKDGVLEVTDAQILVDDNVLVIAEQLDGFPDVMDSMEEAKRLKVRLMVWEHLYNQELPKDVYGVTEWNDTTSAYMKDHGIEFGDNGLTMNQEGKADLIAQMNKDQQSQANSSYQEQVRNAKKYNMDYE